MPEVTQLKPQDREALGVRLRTEFDEVERDKQFIEQEWLKDLRQYKGIYDPEVEAKIGKNKSRAFIRLTRTKVKSTDARVTDMLFPGGTDKNWELTPTPVAEIKPALHAMAIKRVAFEKIQAMSQQLASLDEPTIAELDAKGQLPNVEALAKLVEAGQFDGLPKDIKPSETEVRAAVQDFAKVATNKMAMEIDDQLTEANYDVVLRDVIHGGHLYGTGILKGPLVEKRSLKRWAREVDEEGEEGEWKLSTVQVQVPFVEFVPCWDVYPDMSVVDLDKTDFIFQRHIMTKHQLRRLGNRLNFNQALIDKHIADNPEGDAKFKTFETELQSISKDQVYKVQRRKGKYEVLERWGYIDGFDLRMAGIEIPDDQVHKEYEGNIWLLGEQVIKLILNPSDAETRPFHFYYFEKDETSIWGNSIPGIIRDPQKLFNASWRAMFDNAAIAAGPNVEVNVDLMDDDEDLEDIFAFRVWLRKGTGIESQYPAVRFHIVPSYTNEYLALGKEVKQMLDETSTLPGFVHGEQDPGVTKTARGLSMLFGAANVTLKDVVKNFDLGITEPFITAMYHWNMQFNDREDIKGDFQTKARGSTALVAKEIAGERLELFAQNTKDPIDNPWIKRGELNRERAKSLDMDPAKFVKTDEEVDSDKDAEIAALTQQLEALTAQVKSQGSGAGSGVPA